MGIGYAVVWAGLILAILSVLAYLLSGRQPNLQKLARRLFIASALMVFGAEAVLQYLLISGRYDIGYIWNYSERSLPLWYKIAGAWAGQQGSFLLWTLWTAIYGLILLRSVGSYERHVMMVYGAVVAFLLGILAYESPFAPLEGVPPGMVVEDGFGLNPSLENIWMTIHPPIIFSGFAALTILFAYAIAALIRREYHEWVIRVRPWAIYATTLLGFGLALGGFWAYETLGWGGFWAWDPVENCSFFPWLAGAAFLHGIMLQINRGRMIKWNPFLGAMPFLLFAYGTFLTRSGLMADVSVHSFVSMQQYALWILIGMVILGTFGTMGLWIARWRNMPRPLALDEAKGISREAAMKWGVILLSSCAWLVVFATSAPIITQLINGKPTKPEASFYNQMLAPWVIITALLMATAPMMVWKGMSVDSLLERITKSWLVTLVFAFTAYYFGLRQPVQLLVVTFLFFMIAGNVGAIWRRIRTSQLTLGGFLAHAGLAIGLIGLVVSSAYESKQRIVVGDGQDTFAFGYQWRYLGMTGDPDTDKQNRVRVEVSNHDGKFIAEPRYYKDSRSGQANSVFWPWIKRNFTHDLYISFFADPVVDTEHLHPLSAQMKEGESVKLEPYRLKFLNFKLDGQMGQPGFAAGARVEVSKADWKEPVVVTPAMMMQDEGFQRLTAPLPDGAVILIERISATDKMATFNLLHVPGKPETVPQFVIPLEVYYKPMTILVWLGPPVTLLGGLLASLRRARDTRPALTKLRPKNEAKGLEGAKGKGPGKRGKLGIGERASGRVGA